MLLCGREAPVGSRPQLAEPNPRFDFPDDGNSRQVSGTSDYAAGTVNCSYRTTNLKMGRCREDQADLGLIPLVQVGSRGGLSELCNEKPRRPFAALFRFELTATEETSKLRTRQAYRRLRQLHRCGQRPSRRCRTLRYPSSSR